MRALAILLVSIPAHCKAYFVLAASMPALWQLSVICLTIVLGEAGHELDIAAVLAVNAFLASSMERKGGGWAVMAEFATAVILGGTSWLQCLIVEILVYISSYSSELVKTSDGAESSEWNDPSESQQSGLSF